MARPIKQRITDTLSSFFSKQSVSVVGIDLGSSFLKVVQLKKKNGRAVLETYGELALGPYADASVGQATNLPAETIAGALNDLFQEANVTTKNSAIALPLSSSLLSLIEMPAISDKQLEKMIPIEARKYIPVPITEITLDWWVVPQSRQDAKEEERKKEGKRKMEVLVVAIHNEVINKLQDIVKAVPLERNFLELEVFSTARSTFGSTSSSVMIFDMGAATTKLSIVESGIIRNQHIINRGSQDITRALSQSMNVSIDQAEKKKREIGLSGTGDDVQISDVITLTLDHIFSEANRVLLNYQRKQNRTIKSVVLAGGGVLMPGLFDRAKESLETDVMFADPFSKVEAPAFLDPVLKDAGPEFASAIGLALRKLQDLE